MRTFEFLTGTVTSLPQDNVDTDQIVPARFLKATTRIDLSDALFSDLRFDAGGRPLPEFPLNTPHGRSTAILITGENFGCGSSREHAVWAIADFGIRCLIGPSFADIFARNCIKNGVLPIILPSAELQILRRDTKDLATAHLRVLLRDQMIVRADGSTVQFEISAERKRVLVEGADPVSDTLAKSDAIGEFERTRAPTPIDALALRAAQF